MKDTAPYNHQSPKHAKLPSGSYAVNKRRCYRQPRPRPQGPGFQGGLKPPLSSPSSRHLPPCPRHLASPEPGRRSATPKTTRRTNYCSHREAPPLPDAPPPNAGIRGRVDQAHGPPPAPAPASPRPRISSEQPGSADDWKAAAGGEGPRPGLRAAHSPPSRRPRCSRCPLDQAGRNGRPGWAGRGTLRGHRRLVTEGPSPPAVGPAPGGAEEAAERTSRAAESFRQLPDLTYTGPRYRLTSPDCVTRRIASPAASQGLRLRRRHRRLPCGTPQRGGASCEGLLAAIRQRFLVPAACGQGVPCSSLPTKSCSGPRGRAHPQGTVTTRGTSRKAGLGAGTRRGYWGRSRAQMPLRSLENRPQAGRDAAPSSGVLFPRCPRLCWGTRRARSQDCTLPSLLQGFIFPGVPIPAKALFTTELPQRPIHSSGESTINALRFADSWKSCCFHQFLLNTN
ncbi:hypothetical protein H8959_007235 [Pygathrix nigripes]